MESKVDPVQIVFVVFTFTSYVLSIVFAYLNQPSTILFLNTTGQISRKYETQATPKSPAFAIAWSIIYIWNFVSTMYLLVSCCLPVRKSPVLLRPTLAPKSFLAAYSLVFLTTIAWLFAFDREILELSLALLLLGAVAAYAATAISHKVVWDNSKILKKDSNQVLVLMRVLVHNALAFFATWLTIASLLNLADVIIYQDSLGVSPAIQRGIISIQNGSTVVLAILLVLIITWFVLENFVWEKYCRWTFTIYPVLILALSALVAKLRPLDDARQNLIFASVNLGVVLVAFVARIILTVYRAVGRKSRNIA